ncbi:AGE family epimerase/isomerase [Cupriavidus sp. H19C3]|uniref:AGE family epimerase/isomerase n=1 Tax=Cupriavidus sp. H19C3 TaxID=3241603 RepID=UPI003BF87BAD
MPVSPVSPPATASTATASTAASHGSRSASTLAPMLAPLFAHYDTVVLPAWTGPGWHAGRQLAHEALDGASGQPRPDQRFRAMACARQLFVFARAGNLDHARTLFGSLQRYFGDGAGAWIYSVDAAGAALDVTRDLYTHAFVIFAAAHYFRAAGDPQALTVLRHTVDVVEQRFANGNGLYHAALAEDFGDSGAGVLQNPIMHLTEAYLAALAATGDSGFATRLRALASAVHDTFVDPATGCIAELPQGAAGNRIEPGHQFEWYALVKTSPALFDGTPLPAALERAYAFARRFGVSDEDTMGVPAALRADGDLLDGAQRIWAQTEFARALGIRGTIGGDESALRDLARWIGAFRVRFLHPLGWHEVLAPDGSVSRAEMPSTTPYHLLTAYDALRALP